MARLVVGRVSLYIEPRDAWVGVYVALAAVYVCPLPFVVVMWRRGASTAERSPRCIVKCFRCGKTADEFDYDSYKDNPQQSNSDYVRFNDGTFNPDNGHFACDECYIAIGTPTRPDGYGWKAP